MGIEQHQVKAAELLHAAGILPVVTVHTLDQARAVSAALLEGGLPAIELTLRTPVAMDALAMLKRELPDVVVGAGTVLTVEQMQQSIDAGADFLVTRVRRRPWPMRWRLHRCRWCRVRPRRPNCCRCMRAASACASCSRPPPWAGWR